MTRTLALLALLSTAGLVACDPTTDDTGSGSTDTADPVVDADADGYPVEVDCNDDDDTVHPDADELCNEVDDDCDGETDEEAIDTTAYFADADADGFGDPDTETQACEAPDGHVELGGDCDDGNDAIHPDATEVCDADRIDEDCDGDADDDDDSVDPAGFTTFYADVDDDGAGDAEASLGACHQPDGYVLVAGDCDDGNAATQSLCVDGAWSASDFKLIIRIVRFNVTTTCNGSINLTVDRSSSPEVTGNYSCSAPGGSGGGTVEGTVDREGVASGTLDFGGQTVGWNGTFTNEALQVSLTGRGRADGFDVAYSGGFTASPKTSEE